MTETEPFYVPLGDEVLLHAAGSLNFTDEICTSAGGPSQLVSGHVWLTHDWLAFRPNLGMPHPQMVTLDRGAITEVACVQPKLLGLFKAGSSKLVVRYRYAHLAAPSAHTFTLDSPEGWLDALRQSRRIQECNARELVQSALAAGERDRGRYTRALEQLSFPQGHWYTESPTDRDEALLGGVRKLGIVVPEDFLKALDLEVECETGPEDYEVGPGSEEWGRREQIRRVCEAVNRTQQSGERRFYEYAEDLPEWPQYFEPLWLWLTPAEDEGLRRLGIVKSKPSEG